MRKAHTTLLVAAALALAAPALAQEPVPEGVRRVYAELARQFPAERTPPALELSARGFADFYPSREAIVLGRPAYELFRSFGADSLQALAYVLGHELAHFYAEHADRMGFEKLFSGLATAQAVSRADSLASAEALGLTAGSRFKGIERVRLEAEADLKAGFAAYLAGYEPLEVAHRLLPAVYEQLNMDTAQIALHPPLADRLRVVEIVSASLDRLIQVFEGGVALMVVGQYQEAARVFDHLARAFPSREVLSNAGTARALQALDLLGDDVSWAYPFELDVETRLAGSDRGGPLGFGEEHSEAARLLREAQGLFERARLRDPEYLPAWVNLAAVHQLLEEEDFALAYAERALELAEELDEAAPRAHALVVRGIVRAEAGDQAGARADFAAAAAAAPTFSEANLQALEGGQPVLAFASDEMPSYGTEAIGGFPGGDASFTGTMRTVLRAMGERVQLTLPAVAGQPQVGVVAGEAGEARVFSISGTKAPSGATRTILVLATPPGYAGESAGGIKVGDPLSELRDAYGDAGQVIATRQGAYHVYTGPRIAFAVDAERGVTGWMVWHEEAR